MIHGTVSIIVPVYNAKEYLRDCIESILNQTYHRIELILVDDGSTDGSDAICREYSEKDDRVIYVSEPNCGAAAARNTGINVARGEFIGFCDADDTVEPDTYEYLMFGAITHEADVSQCGVFYEKDGESKKMYTPKKPLLMVDGIESASGSFLKHLAPSTWCKLYRSRLIKGIKYRSEYVIGEDLRFNLDVLGETWRAVLLPAAKYHYIQRPTSLCHTGESVEKITSYRRMLLDAIKDHGASPVMHRYMRERLCVGNCDLASKAVRLGLETERILAELKSEIRGEVGFIIFKARIPLKEKIKLLLIGYAPGLYKRIVNRS